jgi:hypothetical protein
MAQIYVDQSGKVEQKEYDTVIGASRLTESSAVIVDRRLKREIFEYSKGTKQQKVLGIFSASVFLAIKPLFRKGDAIIIDDEYPKLTEIAAQKVRNLIKRNFGGFDADIAVGKTSFAADMISKHPSGASFVLTIDYRNKNLLLQLMKK